MFKGTTQDEIVRLIKKGESETVEFKRQFDHGAIETLVAFANTRGNCLNNIPSRFAFPHVLKTVWYGTSWTRAFSSTPVEWLNLEGTGSAG
jgi:hypothetical protein